MPPSMVPDLSQLRLPQFLHQPCNLLCNLPVAHTGFCVCLIVYFGTVVVTSCIVYDVVGCDRHFGLSGGRWLLVDVRRKSGLRKNMPTNTNSRNLHTRSWLDSVKLFQTLPCRSRSTLIFSPFLIFTFFFFSVLSLHSCFFDF